MYISKYITHWTAFNLYDITPSLSLILMCHKCLFTSLSPSSPVDIFVRCKEKDFTTFCVFVAEHRMLLKCSIRVINVWEDQAHSFYVLLPPVISA